MAQPISSPSMHMASDSQGLDPDTLPIPFALPSVEDLEARINDVADNMEAEQRDWGQKVVTHKMQIWVRQYHMLMKELLWAKAVQEAKEGQPVVDKAVDPAALPVAVTLPSAEDLEARIQETKINIGSARRVWGDSINEKTQAWVQEYRMLMRELLWAKEVHRAKAAREAQTAREAHQAREAEGAMQLEEVDDILAASLANTWMVLDSKEGIAGNSDGDHDYDVLTVMDAEADTAIDEINTDWAMVNLDSDHDDVRMSTGESV